MSKAKKHIQVYLTLLVISGLILSYIFIPEVASFSEEAWEVLSSNDSKQIKSWIEGFGWLGPFILIIAMVIQMFLIIVPSFILMLVSVLAYGPVLGSIINLAGIYLASTIGYFIGRYLSANFVMQLLGETTEQKIEKFIKDYGLWAVVITRLNPFLSNDAISFVGGIVKMRYWRFIGATFLGIIPLTLLIAIVKENTDDMKQTLLWVSLISLLIFVSSILWKKYSKK